MTDSIVNIAAYKFVTLDGLDKRRTTLQALCDSQHLKGTILLSTEGINLFVAGTRSSIDALVAHVRADPVLTEIEVKESFSDHKPFNRMLVKIKHEIIAFGIQGINPREHTSPRISPRQLKQWLDEGRPVTLLDTRNRFECELGTFDGALSIEIEDFRSFPRAVKCLPEELKRGPVVTFCTGGIRCEKAAPLMERLGFREVYQLDGGILKYFEECGGEHFHGECFVFDKRVALDSTLSETETSQCFACQATLSPEDRKSAQFELGKSCPHCYQPPEIRWAETISERHEKLKKVTIPLPGSTPYENRRPVHVAARFDGLTLVEFLSALHTHISREEWANICNSGLMQHKGSAVSPETIVRAGQRYEHVRPASTEPDVNPSIKIIHEDEALVVINKPAPLPMHPCGRFNRNTLAWILERVYEPLRLRLAHRLDANTSGIVLFSKTRRIASAVQPQFERGEVRKSYLALVHGRPNADEFVSTIAIGEVKSATGTRLPHPDGCVARTEFRLLREHGDGTTLLEARPITGRTNQIRIHLWDMNLPIIGDPLFLVDRQLGRSQTLSPNDPPMCLHARSIELTHPLLEKRVRYETAAPAWANQHTDSCGETRTNGGPVDPTGSLHSIRAS